MRATRALLRAPGWRAWQKTSFGMGSVGLHDKCLIESGMHFAERERAVVISVRESGLLLWPQRSTFQHQVDALPATRLGVAADHREARCPAVTPCNRAQTHPMRG